MRSLFVIHRRKRILLTKFKSTPYVPFRDIMAFVAVMNSTIKHYLAAKGHTADVVDKMHEAWCKSIQLQMSLWIGPYTNERNAPREW